MHSLSFACSARWISIFGSGKYEKRMKHARSTMLLELFFSPFCVQLEKATVEEFRFENIFDGFKSASFQIGREFGF